MGSKRASTEGAVLAPFAGVPMNRGHSPIQKGPFARSVIVVVLSAIFTVVFGHAWAMEVPTISRAALFSEDIFIVNCAPKLQILGAIPNRRNLFFGQERPLHVETQFLLGEEGQGVDWARGRRITKGRPELAGFGYHGDVRRVHEQVRSGRDPIIFPHGSKNLVCLAKIVDAKGADANIGAQLPFFGFLHDRELALAGQYLTPAIFRLESPGHQEPEGKGNIESDTERERNLGVKFYPFASVFFGVVFVVFFSKGFKRFVKSGGFLSGAAMMGLGWSAAAGAVTLSVLWIIGH
jgi:hypothetical protein